MNFHWCASEALPSRIGGIIRAVNKLLRLVIFKIDRIKRHQPAKEVIDGFQQRPAATEVLLKIDDAPGLTILAKAPVARHKASGLGKPKSINTLLHVSDAEQISGQR